MNNRVVPGTSVKCLRVLKFSIESFFVLYTEM